MRKDFAKSEIKRRFKKFISEPTNTAALRLLKTPESSAN